MCSSVRWAGVMIHEVFRYLSSTLNWHEVVDTGWPLFRLLARLEYFAYLEMGSSNPLNELLQGMWSYAPWQPHELCLRQTVGGALPG